jgi:hypothetical protein
MYYIIYTDLIDKLIFILQSEYLRISAISCLVEIASLKIDPKSNDQLSKFMLMLSRATIELNKIFPLLTDKNDIQNLKNSVRRKWHVF